MTLAYFLNTYPITSTTFIRREIVAHEEAETAVLRYAIRPWADDLVDPRDRAEGEKTRYILFGARAGMLADAATVATTRPARFLRAARLAFRLWRRDSGLVRHVAYLLEGASLARRCAADGVTRIHAHFGTNSAGVAMLARVMGGPPYSFTAHGPDEFVDAERLSFDEKIARADHVVAISSYCREKLKSLSAPADHAKIAIVRCGIFLEEFAFAPPDAASRAFVCVGRLCPQKGQKHLPAAMAIVRRRFPEARLVLIGDGEDRPLIEGEIARLGLGDAIELVGWRSNAEVGAAIRASRAMILPSYAEGLPIVIMEALATGRPVISTRIAGIPELLDASCGWVCEPGDEAGFAAAMIDALEADEARLAAMGAAGRARVEALHDQRKNAATLRALLLG